MSDTQLKTMIASTAVSEIDADGFKEAWQGQVDNIDGYEVIEPCVLYKRGIQASFCTLILTGKMIVLAGKDRFRADAGAWKVLGTDALLRELLGGGEERKDGFVMIYTVLLYCYC